MPQPRTLILRAPGTNCDRETAYAFERAGARVESLHTSALLERPERLDEFQILCLPGGFSYGDDIAAGRILGNQIRHHLAGRLQEFRASGKLVLGICNGFQVLVRSGLLFDDQRQPGGPASPGASLTWNESGRFVDRWVRLVTQGSTCVFFSGIRSLYLPVAHAEGRFVAAPGLIDSLAAAGRLCLKYAPGDNPNGSEGDVAGVCDATGRVCGLMPHPERHVDPTQHPRWTRGEAGPAGDGLAVFQNAVAYLR